MEYNGKLYGKVGNKFFDTGRTSDDYDTLKKRHDKALELLGELTLRFECLKKSFELLGNQTQQQEKPINKK